MMKFKNYCYLSPVISIIFKFHHAVVPMKLFFFSNIKNLYNIPKNVVKIFQRLHLLQKKKSFVGTKNQHDRRSVSKIFSNTPGKDFKYPYPYPITLYPSKYSDQFVFLLKKQSLKCS